MRLLTIAAALGLAGQISSANAMGQRRAHFTGVPIETAVAAGLLSLIVPFAPWLPADTLPTRRAVLGWAA